MRSSSHPLVFFVLGAMAGCAREPPYCGGFEHTVSFDVSVQRLSLDLNDMRPVQAEICPMLPRQCPCVQTDANGLYVAQLPAESEILVEVRAPRYHTTVATTTTGTADRIAALRLIERTTVAVLGSLLGERVDRQRGHLAMRLGPDEGASVAGAAVLLRNVETDDVVPVVYVRDGAPTRDALVTDESGVVLAFNVPPGRYRAESSALATCAMADGGWPRFDALGRMVALEMEIRADAVTLINALRCTGPGT